MPLYDFRCRACGTTFDRMRSMAQADAPTPCDCGSNDTTRLLSRIAPVAQSASVGGSAGSLPMAGGSAPSAGGGCCGGGCCG